MHGALRHQFVRDPDSSTVVVDLRPAPGRPGKREEPKISFRGVPDELARSTFAEQGERQP